MASKNYKKTIVLGLDYSEFSGGIDECKSKMKLLDAEFEHAESSMDKTTSASERLATKQEYLTQKINLQKQKVELAKQKYDELMNSHANTSAIDKADAALLRERTELNKLQKELEETQQANIDYKATVLACVAALTALAAGFGSCVQAAAEYADTMNTISAQTGVSTQTLQEWDYASKLIDTDLTTMTDSFKRLEKNMRDNQGAFDALGVSVTNADGSMRNAESVFYDVIDALHNVSNATEQDQMAMDIFGRSATELTGVINAGSKGLAQYAEEANNLGRIMSSEQINNAQEYADAMDKLNSAFESIKNSIGAELAPILTRIVDLFSQIPTEVATNIAIVGGLATAIGLVTVAVTAAKVAYYALAPAMQVVTTEMMIQGGYVTAIATAIAALVLLLKEAVEQFQKLSDILNDNGFNSDFLSTTKAIFTGKVTDSTTGQVYNVGAGEKIYRYASGGISNGGTAWVGENGPELVELPAGAKVYNSIDSRNMAGGNTYNISMNCDLSKMKSVNDVVNAVSNLGLSAGGA